MKAYWAVVSARFRTLLQYRGAALAGFGTQAFWGLIRVMIFTAFYASSDGSQPMTLRDTITYVWLGQALIAILPWNWDREVHDMIRSGQVAYELVRPIDSSLQSDFSFYLLHPEGRPLRPDAARFRDWLLAEAQGNDGTVEVDHDSLAG